MLRIADNQFIWFSADVPPDEGLMPVERIRQILSKTRFLHAGNAMAVPQSKRPWSPCPPRIDPSDVDSTHPGDTLQYALEKGEGPTCVDVGRGPGFVQPPKLDLDETECVLE